jgi:GMP synthase (glutamine-hydrolysing)
MRVIALNHVPFENPGYIRSWASERGHSLQEVPLYEARPLPNPDGLDWLVIMGGPMSVSDEDRFPWLVDEKKWVDRFIAADKMVMGICFGAQIIADVLGAKVDALPHLEVGWHPIEMTGAAAGSPLFAGWPGTMDVFHWHGQMVDLPTGSIHIARSKACENQIFAIDDRVIGIQCHPEMTPVGASALADHCPGDVGSGPYAQSRDEIERDDGRFHAANQWMDQFLTDLEKSWKASRSA